MPVHELRILENRSGRIHRGVFDSGLLKGTLSAATFVTEPAMVVIMGIDTREAQRQRSDGGAAYDVLLAHVNEGRPDRYSALRIERHDPFTVIEESSCTVAKLVIRGRAKHKMQLG
jgi:hypothetical protein